MAIFQELGDRWNGARVLSKLGHTLHALGSLGDAHQTFLAALATCLEVGTLVRELDAVPGLARLLREEEQVEQAAELCLQALKRSGDRSQVQDKAKQFWSELRRVLPGQAVAVIEERVRARPLEAVVADLLRANRE